MNIMLIKIKQTIKMRKIQNKNFYKNILKPKKITQIRNHTRKYLLNNYIQKILGKMKNQKHINFQKMNLKIL